MNNGIRKQSSKKDFNGGHRQVKVLWVVKKSCKSVFAVKARSFVIDRNHLYGMHAKFRRKIQRTLQGIQKKPFTKPYATR